MGEMEGLQEVMAYDLPGNAHPVCHGADSCFSTDQFKSSGGASHDVQ